MNFRKNFLISTTIISLLTLPLSASATTGVDRVSILTIQALHTASATDSTGDAFITLGEVVGAAVVATAAAVLTGDAAIVVGATAASIAEAAANAALTEALANPIDTSGSPDDLIANFRAKWAKSNVNYNIQHYNGSSGHRFMAPGQIIQIPAIFALNVPRTSDPKHSSYAYASLKLTEWDVMSADDDLGTLHIPSYAYMKLFGKDKPGVQVEFIEETKTYIASSTVKSPSSGSDGSIYLITYMVQTDAGSCHQLGPVQKQWYGKWWNHKGFWCDTGVF